MLNNWTRGHTSVSDLSSEEKKKLCGCRKLSPIEKLRLKECIKEDAKRMEREGLI